MSTDMISSQASKEVLSSSVTPSTGIKAGGSQPPKASENGNALPPDQAQQKPVDAEELQQAVAQLNERFQQVQRDLQFSVDEASGRSVVRVVDSKTEELVRQIPSEEVLRISQNIEEQLANVTGLLFETSA